MKKILNIEAVPSLLAMAMLGSALTAYYYANFDQSHLFLFMIPLGAFIGDLGLRNTEYQAGPSPATSNIFSYVPRIGFSISYSIFYVLLLWVMHSPKWVMQGKAHSYQFPFYLWLKLLVLCFAILFIALGSTAGRAKPRIDWFNPNPIWINTSTLAFKKTYRLLGWVYIVLGSLALMIDLVNPVAAILFIVCLGLPVILAVWLGYSYVVWKNDPDRIPVGGS